MIVSRFTEQYISQLRLKMQDDAGLFVEAVAEKGGLISRVADDARPAGG